MPLVAIYKKAVQREHSVLEEEGELLEEEDELLDEDDELLEEEDELLEDEADELLELLEEELIHSSWYMKGPLQSNLTLVTSTGSSVYVVPAVQMYCRLFPSTGKL